MPKLDFKSKLDFNTDNFKQVSSGSIFSEQEVELAKVELRKVMENGLNK